MSECQKDCLNIQTLQQQSPGGDLSTKSRPLRFRHPPRSPALPIDQRMREAAEAALHELPAGHRGAVFRLDLWEAGRRKGRDAREIYARARVRARVVRLSVSVGLGVCNRGSTAPCSAPSPSSDRQRSLARARGFAPKNFDRLVGARLDLAPPTCYIIRYNIIYTILFYHS